jgi:hypothetical protein
MAGAPKKFRHNSQVAFSYRTNAESWRVFTALATLKGETPTDIFRAREKSYIEENGDLLEITLRGLKDVVSDDLKPVDDSNIPNTDTLEADDEMTLEEIEAEIAALESKYGTTSNAETIAAMKELDEGGGEVTTIDEIMAELNATD